MTDHDVPHNQTNDAMSPYTRRTDAMQNKLLAEWFWTDRWNGSSAFELPIEARGLYREMLTQAWRRKAKLPNNPEAIRRVTGVTLAEWNRTWPLVKKYWRNDGEHLVNDTQQVIYVEAKGRFEKARERGRNGAHGRNGKG